MKKVITMMVVVVMATCLTQASGALVSHWNFNDGPGTPATNVIAADSVGSNDGTLTNMDPANDWVTGRGGSGYALEFDGESANYDYVNVSDADNLDFTSEFTLDVWVKPGVMTAAGGEYKNLISKDGAYQLQLKHSRDSITIILNDGTTINGGWNFWEIEPITALPTTSWSRVTMSYDNSLADKNVKLYINGVLEKEWDYTTAVNASGYDFTIGAYDYENEGYTGLIDDVSVHNTAVPEPVTMTLLLLGLPLVFRRRGK